MDFKIVLKDGKPEMTLEPATDISNNVYLSLAVRKGSWWFDPGFGCRLHEIKKLTDSSIALAADYVREALKWLLDTGRAKSLDVYCERDNLNRLNVLVEAVQADGRKITFETFVEVV